MSQKVGESMRALMDRYAETFMPLAEYERAERLFAETAVRPMRFIRTNPERPYLERYFLAEADGQIAYLHRFVNGDGDRYIHDHPWDFAASLILTGGYTEFRREGVAAAEEELIWLPGDINEIYGNTLHRIDSTQPETWTLFVHTAWVRDWGFLDDAGNMHRDQSEPDGTHRFWWTRRESMQLHADRTPMKAKPLRMLPDLAVS